MKIVKKVILLGIFSISFLGFFLIPRTYAQEWTYDGVDTEVIPTYSVYPSEWYAYEQTLLPPENITLVEITHGNVSNPGPGNGICVWGRSYYKNITSGSLYLLSAGILISYWNESIGYFGSGVILPVEGDGEISENILNNASVVWESLLSSITFENKQTYINTNSIAFWNETYNNAYLYLNYTDDGIMTGYTSYMLPTGNLTLYSQPAQLSPVFSFTTEYDTLIVNSTDIDLKAAITDADNNNDGITDTEYQYRIFYGSTWTSWAAVPPLIDFNLGSVSAGNYTVTMEVKNMYGTTQEQIEIQYEPLGNGEPPIAGYSTILIAIVIFVGVSFLIFKNRMKR
ncbi:MAG: hypothetical protein ACFFA3_20330 [Promethearchaeota archaeon]